MGSRYTVRWSSYPHLGFFEGSYGCDTFASFLVKLIWAVLRYPIVDANFRDHRRMSKVDVGAGYEG